MLQSQKIDLYKWPSNGCIGQSTASLGQKMAILQSVSNIAFVHIVLLLRRQSLLQYQELGHLMHNAQQILLV